MKRVMLTSGGISSFITLTMVVEEWGAENVVSLFSDTLIEDEDLYRFLKETHAHLGLPITRIADGRNPWQIFQHRGMIANSRVDTCSEMLKRKLMDRWIKKNFPDPGSVCVYIGIDYLEKHRYDRLWPRKLPYTYAAPMVGHQMMLTPAQKNQFCLDRGIQPPRLYEMGFAHNNCGGFCVKAGLGQFKLLWEKMPERYLLHERTEAALIEKKPNLRPFLRKREKGETRYLTLRQYREEYLAPTATGTLTIDDEIDFGGCGCALE